MQGEAIPKVGATIVTKVGTTIRLTPKTISRNGKRIEYIDPEFDYIAALVRKVVTSNGTATFRRAGILLPYTTASGGRGRRLSQYIADQQSVTIPGITP